MSSVLFEKQKTRRDIDELDTKEETDKQMLESLKQRKVELHEEIEKVKELHLSFDTFLKEEDAARAAEEAEREGIEVLQLEAELERLKVEHAELMERKREQQRRRQRQSLYWDFMVRVFKLTKFDSVQGLMDHLESQLQVQDRLCQQDINMQKQVDEQKKALQTLEEQHRVEVLHKTTQLSRLQTQIEETRSEAPTLERQWNHIQKTATKKTLVMGQIKMATLNLYEIIDDKEDGEEAVDMTDSAKQLDKIKTFIKENEYLEKHQTPSPRHGGQKKAQKARRNSL